MTDDDLKNLLIQQQELNNQQQRANNQQQLANNQQKGGEPKPGEGGDKKPEDGKKEDGAGEEKKRSKKPLIILAIVVLVVLTIVIIWSLAVANLVSTDDAYTDGNSVTIAPKISGYVVEMAVTDNSFVHAGDVMLKIDPRDYTIARDNAAANLALAKAQKIQADATALQANQEYQRQRSVNQRATTQSNVDTATAQQKSAEAQVAQKVAQVAQAQAQLDQAVLNLSYAEMRAPQDGWVTRRNVQLGSYLQAGTPLFELVTKDIWIIANFKEGQLNRMRPGQKVDVKVDAYPDIGFVGHVDTVQMGSGSRFSAFPAENATGNFVKIVQRVPVKIVIDGDKDSHDKKDKNDWQTLPLGLSVEPTVHLGSEPKDDKDKKQQGQP